MPAARVFYLLAAATALSIAGVLQPSLVGVVVALDLLLVAAVAVDAWRLRREPGVQATRHWPDLLTQGNAAEVVVELQAEAGRALSLRLRDALHPGLAAAPQRQAFSLEPGRVVRWTYAIEPRRRGEHASGPLIARVLGPWRLWWRQMTLLPPEPRRVYPRMRWDGKVGHLLMLAHRHALGRNPQRFQGLGSELYALREYLPGDPPNRIHWKASARHGRLISREDTWERGARLVVLLDCGRSMSGRDGDRSKLDHALAAALALARVAAGRGDTVTIAAFAERTLRTLRVHAGHSSLQAAYAALYDLEARLVEPAYDLAASHAIALEARRSTVVLFTSVVDLAAAELLRQAVLRLEKRHRPILINLEDPELVQLAHGEPAGEAEAFAKVAALEIVLANQRLALELRHAGIRVVNAAADRLALEALEAYLAMFAERR
jgi:uncharacterized protein (DUF58 family)